MIRVPLPSPGQLAPCCEVCLGDDRYQRGEYLVCSTCVPVSPKDAIFQHDCDRCEFMGSFRYQGALTDATTEWFVADLYICHKTIEYKSFDEDTIIARVSSEPSDYVSSYPIFYKDKVDKSTYELSTHGPALVEVYKRWVKL